MAVDWRRWHAYYDDPAASLARRLETVRELLTGVLRRRGRAGTVLVSMCAGDGRDVLPVLADGHRDVQALLVELDPGLAATARETARRLELPHVEARVADAGTLTTYADVAPADVLLACGVFGNITDDDLDRTVARLAHLLADDAAVLWTRGDREHSQDPSGHPGDPSELVRQAFARHGYREDAFVRPSDASFRVGLHRRTPRAQPADAADDPVLFAFTRRASS